MKTTSWIKATTFITLLTLALYGSALALTLSRTSRQLHNHTAGWTSAGEGQSPDKDLTRSIRTLIGFPKGLVGNEARVLVHIEVNADGTIQEVVAESTDPSLTQYVEQRLEGAQLVLDPQAWGKSYDFALSFRLVH